MDAEGSFHEGMCVGVEEEQEIVKEILTIPISQQINPRW